VDNDANESHEEPYDPVTEDLGGDSHVFQTDPKIH